jgi:TolB-like protein/Tfp pilus assembly protein PilF
MKRCPTCDRVETDDALAFCRADGTALVNDSLPLDRDAGTAQLGFVPTASETATSILPHTTDAAMSRATAPTTVLPAQPTASTTHELTQPKRRKVVILLALLFAAVAAAAIVISGYLYYHSRKSSTAIESIAVLPFENRSGSPDTDYLSDGLAESLIYRLSQLPNLKVSPTSSVFRYKGKDVDAQKIAADLGVNAVMTGRMVQRGEKLTISVELVDVRINKLLWGEQYERKMSELLATQREIAAEIANKLQLKLSGDEKGLTKRYTDSNQAYQLYLKGQYHFAKRTKDDILKAINYYQQAIKLDRNFALAYARIAEAYVNMPAYPYLSPNEANPEAKAAAQRAIEIDPTLAEGHTFLAYSLAVYDWNWTEAEREFKRAIELDPNSSAARLRYGHVYLAPIGRSDEAIKEISRAVEREPLDIIILSNLSWVYFSARQYDRALDQARKIHDLEPNHTLGRWSLCQVLIGKGSYAEAIALSEYALQTDPESQTMLLIAGYAYAKSGRRDAAKNVIAKYKDLAETQYVSSYNIACLYAALGDKDKAFAELGRAFAEHAWDLHRLKVDPFMDPLRDDPRFADLEKRIGLGQ